MVAAAGAGGGRGAGGRCDHPAARPRRAHPDEGLKAGATQPADLPGILLAALATLGLGLVLGPEAPLIALGSGPAVLSVRRVRKDTPDQAMAVLAAAAAFAAIATVFGSPVIGAVILIEAAGLGGPTLPLILLPGLMSAGIGSVIFLGMGHWTGLSSAAYALSPISLPAFSTLTAAEFGWAILLAVAAALAVFAIRDLARRQRKGRPAALAADPGGRPCRRRPGHRVRPDHRRARRTVLFSGQDAFGSLLNQGTAVSLSTLAFLLLFKGLAWGISSATSAAARPSRPCLSARPGACSPRTCRGSPKPPPWPC